MTKRAVFLDRDGTLIDVVRDEEAGVISVAFHPDQLRLLPGVVDGLKALAANGYVLAIASNQPGPAKGQFSAAAVKRTNDALVAKLAAEGITIAKVAVCMHHPIGGPGGDPALVGPCACRKPLPGLIDDLVTELGVDHASSWMVGDSRGDVEAGRAAKVKTALLFSRDRCELCPLRGGPAGSPDLSGATFAEITKGILGA
jgi:D-glycero-D-manno-heptose 1,7-bisphosphate phosphatase